MQYEELLKDPKKLLEELVNLRKEVMEEGNETFKRWEPNIERDMFRDSALNLACYLALRRRDIRELQKALMAIGLSSLGRLESRVIHNLDLVISNLSRIIGENTEKTADSLYTKASMMGMKMLDDNSQQILGDTTDGRYTRIMVTLPTEAGRNYQLIRDLMDEGMDIARINCAHDDETVWSKMVDNIKKAEKELNGQCKILFDIAGPKVRINRILTTLKNPKVGIGDAFFLTGNDILKEYENMDIICGCSNPEIIPGLKKGEPVYFDDGEIEGRVEKTTDDGVVVRVKKTLKTSVRLKAEKGLNFPDSAFKLNILTDKDKQDLDFATKHGDIINFSFVKDVDDVKLCQEELEKRAGKENASSIAMMVKIETVQAVQNLSEIIMQGASKNPFSVMIARGDLAVELGYIRLSEIQEELMWICEAASVPVVWATQVLEGLVKSAIPSRAEITDAAMSARAEGVMLNKGEFIRDGVQALDEILKRMQAHQYKKTAKLRPLSIANEKE